LPEPRPVASLWSWLAATAVFLTLATVLASCPPLAQALWGCAPWQQGRRPCLPCHAQLLARTPVLLLPDANGLPEQFVVVAALGNFVMGINKWLFLSVFETLKMI